MAQGFAISRLLALAFALLLAGCSAAAEDWPEPSPALWHVIAPTGGEGWLFGTVHALPAGVEWRTAALSAALDQSDVLMVEIADSGEGGGTLFAQMSQTPGQPPLFMRVAPEDRAELAALLERTGQSEADFASVETWAAALMLDSGAGGDPANGVDRALIADAATVRAFETRAGQLRLFDQMPPADQSALLANAIDEASAADPQRAIRAWLTGDMAALDLLAREGLLADPSLRETLLTARNAAWLGPIIAAIERGDSPLVAVGAVHMAGTDGLPALLAARGYTVRRVQ
jgi:uncharacterized protein YbaP (TraB family)